MNGMALGETQIVERGLGQLGCLPPMNEPSEPRPRLPKRELLLSLNCKFGINRSFGPSALPEADALRFHLD